MMNKKGQALGTFRALIISLVVISFVIGIGFLLATEVKSQITEQDADDLCPTAGYTFNESAENCYNGTNTTAANLTVPYNGSSEVLDAMVDIPGWLPLVIIGVIGLVLLGIVQQYQGRPQ